MLILALDPGTEKTGYCLMNGRKILGSGVMQNEKLLEKVKRPYIAEKLVIEMVASYGMPVGREVFETCVWIGRFQQAWHKPEEVQLVYRKDVQLHICGSPRANDATIRRALIDLYPATGGGKVPQIGTKSLPGPLYGVSSHVWAALAVGITAQEATA